MGKEKYHRIEYVIKGLLLLSSSAFPLLVPSLLFQFPLHAHIYKTNHQKVNIGPADISFELWYNGQKISQANSISVEWKESAPPKEVPAPSVWGDDSGSQWVPVGGEVKKKVGSPVRGSEGGNYAWG